LQPILKKAWKTGNKLSIDRFIHEIEAPLFEHGERKYGWNLSIKVALEHFGLMSFEDRMPLMPLNEMIQES
jgi:hypothetical protein